MQKRTITFQGFTLSLEYDGETIFAWITKGKFSSFLGMAETMGEIENSSWTATLPVPDSVVEKFQQVEQEFSDSLPIA